MEFKEYQNPEANAYDLRGTEETMLEQETTKTVYQLMLNALRENYDYDLTEEDIDSMGMTLNEYLHPTKETVEKVEGYLSEMLGRSR